MLDFTKIKDYYNKRLWTKDMVKDAVKMGKISHVEYEQITSEIYISIDEVIIK